jgi:DNA-binding transcriptional LysR family regulator
MSTTRKVSDYRIDPFDLKLFAAVLELGTITAAAEAMSLSLAAASTRLKALEGAVGVRLLDRSKHGAVPTAAGRALGRHANRVLAELESLHIEMGSFGRGLRGTIRLVCITAAMDEALLPGLGRFLAAYPDIDIEMQEMTSDVAVDALRREAVDLGVVADYVDTSGLETLRWREDRFMALLPRALAPRRRGPLRFAELVVHPFVGLMPESGLSRFLQREAARIGRVPHHRVRMPSLDAAAQMVAAGVGVAVMPLSAANRWHVSEVRVAPLSDHWARRQLLLCLRTGAREVPGLGPLVESLLACEPPRGAGRGSLR